MAVAAILVFWNHKILLAHGVHSAKTHQCPKFLQNWSILVKILQFIDFYDEFLNSQNIAIFLTAATILNFSNREILFADGVQRVDMHPCAKLCQNGQSIVKILRFFKMVAVCHLGFVRGIFGPPTESTLASVTLKIWLWSMQYSFDNMNVSILAAIGWKTPIHAPKIGFGGNLIPSMGCNFNQSQKGTPFRESASFEPSAWKSGERFDL